MIRSTLLLLVLLLSACLGATASSAHGPPPLPRETVREGGEVRAPDGPRRGRVRSSTESAAWFRRRGAFYDRTARVELHLVEGGGHAIPHPRGDGGPALVGTVRRDLDVPRDVVDFFRSLPPRRGPDRSALLSVPRR